jgi:hypothetical protein
MAHLTSKLSGSLLKNGCGVSEETLINVMKQDVKPLPMRPFEQPAGH